MNRRQAVLAMLVAAADNDLPCPTNGEIADRIGAASVSSGANWIAALEKDGVVKVARGTCSRVVTILATGKRTAGEVPTGHWRLLDSTKANVAAAKTRIRKASNIPSPPVVIVRVVEPTRINRDPCFMCGVRGDIGCRHRASA